MKLTIRRGGGIAGMVARTELDAAALPEPAAEAFAAALHSPGMQKPPAPPPARPWPDAQLYELSLEGAESPLTVHFTDQNLPEDVRQLLAWVDGRPERVESIEH